MEEFIGKISRNGEIVIPAKIRKALGLEKGTEVLFEVKDGNITMTKLSTHQEWADLVKNIPVEEVNLDHNGHYDPSKSPEFHDWMVNG